ncbi:hypothetical protein [Staphylococcus equorum]|uniref:hypothetical protein n=1 Tax=Staphylococcus equorum TaxID=246432 RepID=UPI002DC01E8D|nr:hypothetical protein [Staphylococcus equorum]MEB7675197.1 hypothetical protein [Staphylococcus equorum]
MAIKVPSKEDLKIRDLSNETIQMLNKQIEQSEKINNAKNPNKYVSRRITRFKCKA